MRLKMRKFFFDSPKVLRAVDRATRRVLMRAGASVRLTARNKLRPARRLKEDEMTDEQLKIKRIAEFNNRTFMPLKASDPGEPPRVRPASPLKRLLFFAYDFVKKTVVVGPAKFDAKTQNELDVLEYGGYSKNLNKYVDARPFMVPSLTERQKEIANMWRNSIR